MQKGKTLNSASGEKRQVPLFIYEDTTDKIGGDSQKRNGEEVLLFQAGRNLRSSPVSEVQHNKAEKASK